MLSGLPSKLMFLKLSGLVNILSIKLRPGSFCSLFGRWADAFFNKIVPLKSAIGRVALDFCGVYSIPELSDKIRFINALLVGIAEKRKLLDPRVRQALDSIYLRKGIITVGEMAGLAG